MQHQFGVLGAPVAWLLCRQIPDELDTAAQIKRVRCPLLFIHARDDEVTSHQGARELFDLAGEPKRWVDAPGRHLALIEWAKMMKLFLFVALGIASFFPWGIASSGSLIAAAAAMPWLLLKLAFTGVGLVMIETGLAKMRIFRITEFLGSAFLFATLGMLSYFMLE